MTSPHVHPFPTNYLVMLGCLLASLPSWATEPPYNSLLGSGVGGPDRSTARNNCRFESGGISRATFDLPSQLIVSPSASYGTVVYRTSVSGPQFRVTCPSSHQNNYGYTTPLSYSHEQYYRTNVPGLGIRIFLRETGPGGPNSTYMSWPRGVSSHPAGRHHVTPSYDIELIKLSNGPVSGTLQLSAQLATAVTTPITATELRPSRTTVAIISPNPTCSVDNGSGNIPVFLGDHPRRNFNGIGYVTNEVPFNINLNCSGGSSGGSLNIRFTLLDAHSLGNRTQALSLAPGASAHGVGIRIQRNLNGTPSIVTLGTVQTAGTVYPGTSRHVIHLSAQYIQQVAPSQIRPGLAPGRATFAITYD